MPILGNGNANPLRRLKGRSARSCSLGTKLTPEEQAKIMAAAEADGKVPSEWAREKLLECAAAGGGSATLLTHIYTDLVAVQMLFLNILAPYITGERLSNEQVNEMVQKIQNVKSQKAREILARRTPQAER